MTYFILPQTTAFRISEGYSMHKQTFRSGFMSTYTSGTCAALYRYPAAELVTGQNLQKLDEPRFHRHRPNRNEMKNKPIKKFDGE